MNKKKIISIFILLIFVTNLFMPIAFATGETMEKTTEETTEEMTNKQMQEEKTVEKNSEVDNEQTEQKQKETITEKDEEIKEEETEKIQTKVKAISTTSDKIAEGTYKIKANVGNNMYLDIDTGQEGNGANLQIWEGCDAKNQEFKITDLKNGYYKITAVHSNKVLDVDSAGTANGTNIQQYDSNGTDAQQWIIKSVGDGLYYIISKCNGLNMDIHGGYTSNGTNVQMYGGNQSDAQKFKLEKISVDEGTYKIKANVGNNMYLDIDTGHEGNGANLQIWAGCDAENQKFKVTDLNNGYYKITVAHSNKVLDVASAGTENGTNIQQYDSNGTDAQQWIFKPAGNGMYYIISKCNGLNMDIYGGYTSNGTNVQMYKGNQTNAQQFELQKVDEAVKPVQPDQNNETKPKLIPANIEDGVYKIESKVNTKKVLDIDTGVTGNGANVQLWEDCDAKNQKFHIKKVGENTYSIRTVKYEKSSIDVEGAYKEKGTNVQQYDYNGTDAQQWLIQKTEDGYYTIVSKCNGLVLDVKDGNVCDGANIQAWESNGTDAQKFKLEETKYQILDEGMYEIQSNKDKSRVIDISEAKTEDNAKVQTWSRANVNQQKFNAKYNKEDDTYTFEAVHSGKVLDVVGGIAISGQDVQQFHSNETDAQKWRLVDFGDGTYNIESAKDKGLCLDIEGGNVGDGTQIQIYEKNNTEAQVFNFIKTSPAPTGSLNLSDINTLNDAKYPGFRSALQTLKNNHPNWNIKVVYTGLDWNTVLNNEDTFSGGSPKSLSYDTYVGEWKASDIRYDNGHWYQASRKAIAYMMDPRNSLDADGSWLFQFQDLSNSSGSIEEVKAMVQGTYLNNNSLINTIMSAAQTYNINPLHLVARMLQEQGRDGHGTGNGHSCENHPRTVYNLFNIGATGNNESEVTESGADYATSKGWYSQEASIMGGAEFLSKDYISKGQSTLYFQKYNVVTNPLYDHQYMQNIRAANDEGNSIFHNYKNNGLINAPYTFAIPVYENMPASACPRPIP